MDPTDNSPPFNLRPSSSQSQPPRMTPSHVPRPARSKNGCLTCRRRKVRCDEQQPRCSHCERLNLQCRWRPSYTATQWRFVGNEPGPLTIANVPPSQGHVQVRSQAQNQAREGEVTQTFTEDSPDQASPALASWPQSHGAVDQLFDYASFLWDVGGDVLGQGSPDQPRLDFGRENDWIDPYTSMNHHHALTPGPSGPTLSRAPQPSQLALQPPSQISQLSPHAPRPAEAQDLISYFIRTVVPPILAEVETQKRWSSMRQILVSMSNRSAMVRNAILAFAVLLWCRREAPGTSYPTCYYEDALAEIEAASATSIVEHTPSREHVLATLFFLSYVDILGDRMDGALKHLRRAFQIFQQGNKRGFRPVEVRLLCWLRLLDARTVSAGGEGLFLSDKGEALIMHPSPPSVADDTAPSESNARDEVKEWDIEDVLFQVLYQPGIVFFQKVQSFMGRISKIDPWHRSRGTVEDEMEVMHIASRILADLRCLYDDRPTLMDHAVDGRLAAPHVSPELAVTITRAFRTYLSNYHASKVHLHRVAYKHLPLSRETADALRHIRHLTRLMVDSMEPDATLPVSQLWPLLMLGSEERCPAERAWIREQILRMEKVATNAGVTAQVLEEVQARQDASKSRVDIRAVMHDVFDSCFAIM